MVSIRVFAPSSPDTETTSTRKVNCVFITTEREYRGEEQSHEGVLKSGRSSCQVISLSGTCPAKILLSLPLSAFIAHGVLRGSSRSIAIPNSKLSLPSLPEGGGCAGCLWAREVAR